MAHLLALRNVFPPPPPLTVRYPHTWFDPDDDGVLAFVAWRYHISLALAGRARRRFHWLQDMPGSNVAQLAASPGFVARTDAFFCLSRFHLAALPEAGGARAKAVVTPNALDARYFVARRTGLSRTGRALRCIAGAYAATRSD